MMSGFAPPVWSLKPQPAPAHVEALSRKLGLSPLIAAMLCQRGLEDPDQAAPFLDPRLQNLSDPFLLPGMREAVDRLLLAVDRREKVVLYGDYDVDGVTSLTLFQAILDAYGLPVETFLPHRAEEGYGLSDAGLERCLEEYSPSLLVAADCGTSSIEQVARLVDRGIDVLIFDHHESNTGERPPAVALVNPKLGDDFHYLCTAGIAFKTAHALLKTRQIPGFDLKSWLDIVALGTVADLVPLTGENRILVRKGLEELARTQHPGLRALKEVAGVNGAPTAYDIGFKLGPRLNAAGRLDTARASLDLLTTRDVDHAAHLAQQLNRQNQERQSVEQRIKDEAIERLSSFDPERDLALVVGSREWHPGVVGIVASRITKQFHRPSFVIAFDETGLGKGSGRSIEGVSLVDALNACRDLIEAGGGHEMAAGVTVREENLDAFRERLSAHIAERAPVETLVPRLGIDLEASFGQLDLALLDAYDRVQPLGMGNPAPVFMSRNVRLAGDVRVLKEKHLKLPLAQNGSNRDVLFFNASLDDLPPQPWDIAYRISRNVFRGRVSVSIVLEAIRSTPPQDPSEERTQSR